MREAYTGLDVIDLDHSFVVNSFTREITSKTPQKKTLVQNDHNSERFTFEVPRFIEGRDLSLCNTVNVYYRNGGKSGVYTVGDVAVCPFTSDTVVCSWLISQNATSNVGSLSFMLKFSHVNDTGVVEYSWGTKTYSEVKIVESIVNSDTIVKEYSDLIAKMKKDIIAELTEYIDNKLTSET